jgi:hypothetical protein
MGRLRLSSITTFHQPPGTGSVIVGGIGGHAFPVAILTAIPWDRSKRSEMR